MTKHYISRPVQTLYSAVQWTCTDESRKECEEFLGPKYWHGVEYRATVAGDSYTILFVDPDVENEDSNGEQVYRVYEGQWIIKCEGGHLVAIYDTNEFHDLFMEANDSNNIVNLHQDIKRI